VAYNSAANRSFCILWILTVNVAISQNLFLRISL